MGTHTSRREFLQRSALAVSAAASNAAIAQPANAQSRPPNIVVLLTDDQQHHTIRALGNTYIDTPNMDRIVYEGTAFTHAHIMGSMIPAVCAPSRAAFLTGRSIFRIPDSFTNPWNAEPDQRGACPYPTFPEVFRAAGYTTFYTGKWHNERPVFHRAFTDGGAIFFGGMSDHDQVPVYDFDPDGRYPAEARRIGDGFSSELFTGEAVKFLERQPQRENPFLLFVSYTAPHDPHTPRDAYARRYPSNEMPLPPNFLPEHPFDNGELSIRDEQLAPWPRTPEIIRQYLADYYGMITQLDTQIGRVLDALDNQGLAQNTIVVFASDNGLAVGQHGLLGKQNMYDHSTRVPLVMRGPGIPVGERRDTICYLHDVFPALCALAGVTTPETVESRGLAMALNDPGHTVYDAILSAYRGVQRCIREDRWKLIRYSVGGAETTQLFDMDNDPWELRNLAYSPEFAGVRARLTDRLREAMASAGDSIGAARFQ